MTTLLVKILWRVLRQHSKQLNRFQIYEFFLTAFVILTFLWSVPGQTKIEKPITCEYLKVVLDTLSGENLDTPTESGSRPHTIFVVAPGDRKDSNVKTARKFQRGLDTLLKSEPRYNGLRYTIVETTRKKGYGRFQIYFVDEVKDFVFADNVFLCP